MREKMQKLMLACSIALIATSAGALIVPSQADCGDCPKNSKGKKANMREGFNQPLILSGIKNIQILVGDIDEMLTAQGVSKDHLAAKLKEELSTTHATITESAEACCKDKSSGKASHDTSALLYLKIKSTADAPDSKSGAYSINLSLVEKSKIARNHKDIMASVWAQDAIGKVQGDVKSELDSQLDKLARDFKRDYLLANSADISHPDMPDKDGRKKSRFGK